MGNNSLASPCYKLQRLTTSNSRHHNPFRERSVGVTVCSDAVGESWLQQPAFLDILNHFLRTESAPYNDNDSTVIDTDFILSVAATLEIGLGVKARDFHRNDFIWQQTHTVKEGQGYQMVSDVSMDLKMPGVNTTRANGATLVENLFLPCCLRVLIKPSLSPARIYGTTPRGQRRRTRWLLK